MKQVPEYLVIGHVTKDVVPDGYRVGGTASYASAAAAKLGMPVGVLTSADSTCSFFSDMPLITVERRASEQTTVFENVYEGRVRRQYVRAVAERITLEDLPPEWRGAPIVHLGPIAQEVDSAFCDLFPGALIGVTPQGWLRHWNGQGLVRTAEWADAEHILSQADVVVLSLEDLGGDRHLLAEYAAQAELLVLTKGPEGAIIYQDGKSQHVPAFYVKEVDPTGAGDVFAAAFLIRYYETKDARKAARFGNCVASFLVEREGVAGLPTRDQVEERLRQGHVRRNS